MPNALTMALNRPAQRPAPVNPIGQGIHGRPDLGDDPVYPDDDSEDYTPPEAWLKAQAERQNAQDTGEVKSDHINIPNPLSILKTTADKLSKAESNVLRPFLMEAIEGLTDLADDTISRTNRDHVKLTEEADNLIWSDMSKEEMSTLVDSLLIVGEHEAHVAVAIREVAKAWRYVQVGIITFPRFIKTVRFYGEHGGFVLW